MEVMRVVVGIIQATAVAMVATLLEAAVLLEVIALLLQVAVTHQAVEAIPLEVGGIHLKVAITLYRKRPQVSAGLVYLYRLAKLDMIFALRQTSPISQALPPNWRRSRQLLELRIHCLIWL